MHFSNKPIKLDDCLQRQTGELFVVEGDSAALSVSQARDIQHQAVLPMQGKPMNAMRATQQKVTQNPFFAALLAALGVPEDVSSQPSKASFEIDYATLRYQRIVLLMDPDADGIHCGALMLMFFYRYLRPLLNTGRIEIVHAPLAEIKLISTGKIDFYYNEPHFRATCEQLNQSKQAFHATRYRGLANINADVLLAKCIQINSRHSNQASAQIAEQGIAIFSSSVHDKI